MRQVFCVGLLIMIGLNGTAPAQSVPPIQHTIAAIEPGRFHGWPANNGVWQWGNEILVGFTQGDFKVRDGHNISGIEQSKFARSLDGGETWEMFDPENFLDGPDIKWLPKGKTMLAEPLDFSHKGFAMRVFSTGYHGNDDSEGGFYYSYDRGATWKGPHFLGALNSHKELKGRVLRPRTDYIVTGPRSLFMFITADFDKASRIACVKTEDGGLSFEFVSWVTPATTLYRAVMPQTIRLKNGGYVMAIRKIFLDKSVLESTIEIYASHDECQSWDKRGVVKEIKSNSNPPAIVELEDGRLCCVYGDRDARILAGKYSSNGGWKWGPEFVIRDDYLKADDFADMGYPRLVLRPDGKLAAMYYWADDAHPEHYIACSIWQPPTKDPEELPFSLSSRHDPELEHIVFSQQELFHQGMNGVPVYRIPALESTKAGVVVAVCDARADTGQDLPNDIDLVMRRSLDNGETWSEPKVIADFGKQGCGDAALLSDSDTGRLWCFFAQAADGVGVKTSRPGSGADTLQIYLIHSDDNGESWSAPRNITPEVKPPAWDAAWSTPVRGMQDREGRLYFPLTRKSGDILYSHFIYSDDHGETWAMGGPAGERTEEWTLVQRADGSLLGNMRSNQGKNLRAVATSPDRGITWQGFTHHPQLIEPVCQGSLIAVDRPSGQLLLFSNPADKERQRMTVKLSSDGGETWPNEKVIHEGPAAYSCMAVLPDGQIGLLYECGEDTPYQKIVFAKFWRDWLSYPATPEEASGYADGK